MRAWLKVTRQEDKRLVFAGGDWCLAEVVPLDRELRELVDGLRAPDARSPSLVRLGLEKLERLDTAGAWLIVRTVKALRDLGVPVEMVDAKPGHASLLARLEDAHPCPPQPEEPRSSIARVVEHCGEVTIEAGQEAYRLVSFFGAIMWTAARTAFDPRRWRIASVIHHIENVGLNAVPIVALMSFLIGVVLAYQGSTQLTRFGAEIFTVDLLGVSVLRELGILMTAIIVAGRSGSAFTAQIGTMKVNQEVDAMRVIGLDPLEVLVMPRLIALLIALPLLCFLAIIMALAGGGLMIILGLDIPTVQFVRQLQSAIGTDTLLLGMVKAPVFAFLIAMVGCFEGLRVGGSADSVGSQTTRSVVVSIFLVIVVDAIFSIVYSALGI